ncbi:MAG: hypothetical protein Aurels2KO_56270 [Aureliella sp.]
MAADAGWLFTGGDALYQSMDQAVIGEDGSVYMAVTNRGTIDFAPTESFSDNRDVVTAAPDGRNQLVIAKYDANGNFQWATPSSSGHAGAGSFSVDAGGVYLQGSFDGPADLDLNDPSPTHEIANNSESRIHYYARLDASTGKYDWVKTADVFLEASSAADGTSYVLLTKTGSGLTFDGVTYNNSENFEKFSILVQLDSSGQLIRTQRLGSWEFFTVDDIQVEDSSDNPSEWTLFGTGYSQSILYFGDADQLHLESTAGESNDRFTDRDNHLLAFALNANDGNLKWANVYETDWSQRGRSVHPVADGSVFIDAQSEPESSYADPPGTTIFDPSQPDSAITGAGDFILKLDSNGSFERVLHNEGSLGTYEIYDASADGLLIGVVPDNPIHASSSSPASEFVFANYLLEPDGDTSEFIFSVDSDLQTASPLFTANPHDLDAEIARVGYETIKVHNGLATTAGLIRGRGTFADGSPYTTPTNEEFQTPSFQIFASQFELPAQPDLPTAPTPPVTTVLFADSFEYGQWNGKWVEDSQNDWFTSSQRSGEGRYSAEVDGSANNAKLTVAESFDLSG